MNSSYGEPAPDQHQALCDWLIAETRDTGDETLRDALEGLDDLHAAIACVVRSYLDDLTLAAALGIRLDEMQNRLARLEARAEKKRLLVTSVMERAELKSLAEPDFTVSLRRTPPPLIVTDEGAVPAPYWHPRPPELDRYVLLAALLGGHAIAGARLGNGHLVMSVRTN
jgi:hypothetical protein